MHTDQNAPPRAPEARGRALPPDVRERYETEFLRLWEARDALTDELRRFGTMLDIMDVLDLGGAHD